MAITSETLMNVIQNYRVVYDKSCKEYKDLQNAWKEMGMDVAEVQRR